MMSVLSWALLVILLLSSAILILMVLLHKGKGGGLSSMFGGGMSSVAAGSSVAEKNLTRITIGVGIIWFASIIAFGLLLRTMV
ncbi:preprotein translocase subunit SecG [Glycomyces sp. NPDC047010]|uniref:preprotein translocase subunit SecG n=1 Tax=Glycomyces sp. NPDC047010 TaxID=3155023 RepID=UPI0033EF9584